MTIFLFDKCVMHNVFHFHLKDLADIGLKILENIINSTYLFLLAQCEFLYKVKTLDCLILIILLIALGFFLYYTQKRNYRAISLRDFIIITIILAIFMWIKLYSVLAFFLIIVCSLIFSNKKESENINPKSSFLELKLLKTLKQIPSSIFIGYFLFFILFYIFKLPFTEDLNYSFTKANIIYYLCIIESIRLPFNIILIVLFNWKQVYNKNEKIFYLDIIINRLLTIYTPNNYKFTIIRLVSLFYFRLFIFAFLFPDYTSPGNKFIPSFTDEEIANSLKTEGLVSATDRYLFGKTFNNNVFNAEKEEITFHNYKYSYETKRRILAENIQNFNYSKELQAYLLRGAAYKIDKAAQFAAAHRLYRNIALGECGITQSQTICLAYHYAYIRRGFAYGTWEKWTDKDFSDLRWNCITAAKIETSYIKTLADILDPPRPRNPNLPTSINNICN